MEIRVFEVIILACTFKVKTKKAMACLEEPPFVGRSFGLLEILSVVNGADVDVLYCRAFVTCGDMLRRKRKTAWRL